MELYFTTSDINGAPEITLSLLGTEGYEITDLTYDPDSDTYYFVAYTKYLDQNDPDRNMAVGVMWLYGNGIQMEIHYSSNPDVQSYINTTFYFEKYGSSYDPNESGSNDLDEYYPGAYDPYSNESGTYDPYTEELKAFYGVWISASRSLANASIYTRYLYLPGDYYPQVILSSEWGNLNSDPWFCVTVDKYATQSAAESVLSEVRYYFPDAYVRYSGEFIGE